MARLGKQLLAGASAIAILPVCGPAMAEEGQGQPVQQFDAVTTLGTRTETPYFEVLGSTSIINRDQIQSRIPSTLDDVLRSLPNVQSDGGPRSTAEEFNIRGLGNKRIVLRIDGARSNFQSGHRGRLFLDPDVLRSAAVLRGPSSIYGSGALGGVIGLEVIEARDFLDPTETFGFRGKFGYNSVNREWLQSYTGAAQFGGFGLLGNFAVRRSGDIKAGPPNSDDRRRTVPFSADDIVTGVTKLTIEPWKHHKLYYTFQIYNNNNTIPTAANTDTASLIADRFTKERRHVVGYKYRNPASPWIDLTARAYYNDVDVKEKVISPGTNFGRVDQTDFRTYGLDIFNTTRFNWWKGRVKSKLTYGLEFYVDDQKGERNGAPRLQFPDADAKTLGLYVQNELTLFDQFILLGALRWDRVSLNADGQQSLDDSELSKTGAIGWRPFKWALIYGKYSEAFRAPTLSELYPQGVHFSLGPVNNVFIPNPNLQPEKAKGWEAGGALQFKNALMKGDKLGAKVSFFRTNVDNLIELRVINNFPFGPFTSQSVNIADARLTGFEAEFSYISKYPFLGVSYGRTRGENLTDGGSLRSIPGDKWVVTAGSRIPQLDILAGWRMTIVGRQLRVPQPPDDTNTTGGYVTHDLFVSWVPSGRHHKLLKGLRVDFGVDNVANRRYRKHLSELPEAGRNFKFAISYKVTFGGNEY